MQQNLKEYVKKIVGEQSKSKFPNLYIVDQQTGPYRTIQQAIDAADPYSLIKVTEGFYEQSLIITKPLTIQSKALLNIDISNKNQNPQKNQQKLGVILLVETGIGIHIKLPKIDDQVCLNGLKVSHSGSSIEMQMELLEHQHIISIFEHQKTQIQQLDHEYVNRVILSKLQNMILYVQRGVLKADSCVFSLRYLLKSCKTVIPAICIDKDGQLQMVNSEIKGNQLKQTIGVICKLGTVAIKNSIITDHQGGGILVWGTGNNSSKLIKNCIEKNQIGIHCVGQQFSIKICLNRILNNKVGIKVGIACCAQINRNFIAQNINGIQVHSSFPIIYLNRIQKQKQNGIVVKTHKKLICIAKIKKNVAIVGNNQNGILIEGENNRTKIVDNYLIAFNGGSGIKITKSAFPLILKNRIHKNYKQGILITQNTNSTVCNNHISANIQCNISLGGINSHQTLISENLIEDSNGVGVFVVEGCPQILRNDIVRNHQGILCMGSHGNIRRNYIVENVNNGIVLKDHSMPTLVQNFIMRNCAIGLYISDKWMNKKQSIKIFSNIIVSNQINVGMEIRNQFISEGLKNSNTIDGLIDMPEGLKCSIM